jgi:hypothetical protein
MSSICHRFFVIHHNRLRSGASELLAQDGIPSDRWQRGESTLAGLV